MKVCVAYGNFTMNATVAMDEASKIHSSSGLYTTQRHTKDVIVYMWGDKYAT